MTLEEMKTLPLAEQKKLFDSIKVARHKGKATVYSATYGVGKEKLARELGIPEYESKALLDAFWGKNWAVREVAKNLRTKTINGQTWVYNPISGFWLSLRYDKDRWSTLNQSSGVYCFDTWVYFLSKRLPDLKFQAHDEVVLEIPKGEREKTSRILNWAIDKTNEKLKLNVKLGISVQYGDTYGQIH
jgi:DNA polymerase I-like protein with 3'-5' exonuclease and polymerase domains